MDTVLWLETAPSIVSEARGQPYLVPLPTDQVHVSAKFGADVGPRPHCCDCRCARESVWNLQNSVRPVLALVLRILNFWTE
jgi:hypothetical protein